MEYEHYISIHLFSVGCLANLFLHCVAEIRTFFKERYTSISNFIHVADFLFDTMFR